jgi:hypothetical protein
MVVPPNHPKRISLKIFSGNKPRLMQGRGRLARLTDTANTETFSLAKGVKS